ncbi:MAG: polysaccharide biosynthesis C-terminal domain-containing protein [bacterium]|nr:polysaccharide biosynthesis C-terminal domain-containing protein [bacterium]
MVKNIEKIMKNDYVFSLFQKMINILTGIITVAIINRYLGVSLKGEYEYIKNIVNVLNIIFGFGLYASYPYLKRKKESNQLEKYLDLFFSQAAIYFIICAIIAIIIKDQIIILSSLLIITQILFVQLQNIGVVEFIRYRQVLQIFSYFFELILVLLAYFLIPRNINVLLIILLFKYIICILAYLIKCSYVPHLFQVPKEFVHFTFRFGFFAMLTTLLMEFNYSIDVIIMKFFLPYSEIGLYSVGSKLAQYVWLIPDSFKEVIFSRTAKKDSIEEVKLVLRINVCITLLMIFMVFIFGKFFIQFLYGSEYVAAYSVTLVIFLGIPSMVLYKLISPLYTANGRQLRCFVILSLSVLFNVVVNFFLIPAYGKMGAACSTVLSYTMCGFILFIDFIKMYNLKWYDCLILKKDDIQKLKHKLFPKKVLNKYEK